MVNRPPAPRGFTLIELSVVLVIIGLIIGGVLVGQDLIRAAQVRAQITQIEKFNTAINAFYGKYGALPGDLNAATAHQFGFTPRGTNAGQGDGNGMIEWYSGSGNVGFAEGGGETGLFWVDLSSANGLNVNMIEGSFSSATINPPASIVTTASMNLYLPAAKIGGGNYVYVGGGSGGNAFGISVPQSIDTTGTMTSSPGMTVQQAYSIDNKIDDGLPETGNVVAAYVSGNVEVIAPNAAAPSATTCFDTTSGQYSLSQNGGSGVNCALGFYMQAGD